MCTNPLFPRRRESSQLDNPRKAGQHLGIGCFAVTLFCWISACAGMTSLAKLLCRRAV